MIVKDEAAVIDRCLASVRDLIDCWVICDTGSSDDTRERVRAALSGLPGVLHEHPWVDFGHNRSRAIELARGTADHLLLLDADMEVVTGPSFDPRRLGAGDGAGEGAETADGYLIRYEGSLDYRQVLLVRGDLPWKYVGVTHEYLDADLPYRRGQLDGLTIRHLADGANRGDKFERDRRLLEAHLETAPDDSRAWFYLGQTHFDLGSWDAAIAAYERRLEMRGWDEELWVARYKIALARRHRQHQGDDDPQAVLGALLEAWQARPSRLEPLYVAARTAREAGDHHLGHLLSRPILDASYPSDILFVERDVYRYLLAFEHSICSYWVGRHAEAVRLCNGLLELPDLPPAHREAVVRNRRFSLDLRAPAPHEDGEERPRPRLLVVVPFFNPGVLLVRVVTSLQEQEPPCPAGFEVVLVDDGSTDGYGAIVADTLPDGWSLLTQSQRLGAAAAVRRAVTERSRPDDVVVVLSGEGRLAAPDALATVAATYARRPCEATYGQHRRPGIAVGGARPFVDRAAFDCYLSGGGGGVGALGEVGPLLTFRARLLEPAPEEEPFTRAGEDELARAVLARAGFDQVAFVDEVLAEVSRFH